MTEGPLTEEQKQYLQGFLTAVKQSGPAPFAGVTESGKYTEDPSQANKGLTGPVADKGTLFGTKLEKLCKEEKVKLELNPLDMWDKMVALAESDSLCEGGDVFRFKFHGLFNTSPIQPGYMLRTRIPGCAVNPDQLQGLADIAEDFGGGYAHVTTRGNTQIREIQPRNTVPTITKLYDIGLTSRGAGGDNIRNITASPISGVDPAELYDCTALSKAMHHAILNTREFYGLPRKFNIAFDGGGVISIMGDTNDIGFIAVRVPEGGRLPAGIYFKLLVGGVVGHGHFAKETGILLTPSQCVAYACGILRVFVKNGNRTNRKRARLAFCYEAMGKDAFLAAVQEEITFTPETAKEDEYEPRGPLERFAHVGCYPQSQKGLNYIGVAMMVGKMTVEQMRGLAELARENGDGLVRFTIWQNLILTGIPDENVKTVKQALIAMGFHYEPSKCISGLAACTGNTGCKLSQTDTKGEAELIAKHLEATVPDAPPMSIVLTGCPNSCAQHFCSDIGLLGVKTKIDGKSVEAYNITLGGGTDHDQGLGREVARGIPYNEVPKVLENIVNVYKQQHQDDEDFVRFVRRHNEDELKTIFQEALPI